MRLTAPAFPVFLISFLLAALVIAIKYFDVYIPIASQIVSGSMFEILLVAYAILFLGNIIRSL